MQRETFHKFTSIGLRLTEFQHCIQMIVSFYYEGAFEAKFKVKFRTL